MGRRAATRQVMRTRKIRPWIAPVLSVLLPSACVLGEAQIGDDDVGESTDSQSSDTADETTSETTSDTADETTSDTTDDTEGTETGEEPVSVCGQLPEYESTTCGDGLVLGAETCDDGNAVAGDGCSACVSDVSGNILDFFPSPANRHIAVLPGPVPEQTTVFVARGAQAEIVALDVEGNELWVTAPDAFGSQARPGPLRALEDGSIQAVGWYGDEEAYEPRLLWTARLDAQGGVSSYFEFEERSLAVGDPLLRADGSMVVVGGYDGELYHYDNGVWGFDSAGSTLWSALPWGEDPIIEAPKGATEQSDGTVMVLYSTAVTLGGLDDVAFNGVGLIAFDPADGDELWRSSVECDEPPFEPSVRARNIAALSDGTLLVVGDRVFTSELFHLDAAGELISRERWPDLDETLQVQDVIADEAGGAWIAGPLVGSEGAWVGYWHPDPARRWIGGAANPYRDIALEPDERLWLASEDRITAIAL